MCPDDDGKVNIQTKKKKRNDETYIKDLIMRRKAVWMEVINLSVNLKKLFQGDEQKLLKETVIGKVTGSPWE